MLELLVHDFFEFNESQRLFVDVVGDFLNIIINKNIISKYHLNYRIRFIHFFFDLSTTESSRVEYKVQFL